MWPDYACYPAFLSRQWRPKLHPPRLNPFQNRWSKAKGAIGGPRMELQLTMAIRSLLAELGLNQSGRPAELLGEILALKKTGHLSPPRRPALYRSLSNPMPRPQELGDSPLRW